MLPVTKMRCKYAPKMSEFYQSQLAFGLYFLIKSIEREKMGTLNFRKLNIYVLAHDFCGVGLKDKTITKKAHLAVSVFESIFKSEQVKPKATELQLKALWARYLGFIEDIKHIPADTYGTALKSAYTTEEIEIKSGRYATREALYESDLKQGLIYETA